MAAASSRYPSNSNGPRTHSRPSSSTRTAVSGPGHAAAAGPGADVRVLEEGHASRLGGPVEHAHLGVGERCRHRVAGTRSAWPRSRCRRSAGRRASTGARGPPALEEARPHRRHAVEPGGPWRATASVIRASPCGRGPRRRVPATAAGRSSTPPCGRGGRGRPWRPGARAARRAASAGRWPGARGPHPWAPRTSRSCRTRRGCRTRRRRRRRRGAGSAPAPPISSSSVTTAKPVLGERRRRRPAGSPPPAERGGHGQDGGGLVARARAVQGHEHRTELGQGREHGTSSVVATQSRHPVTATDAEAAQRPAPSVGGDVELGEGERLVAEGGGHPVGRGPGGAAEHVPDDQLSGHHAGSSRRPCLRRLVPAGIAGS